MYERRSFLRFCLTRAYERSPECPTAGHWPSASLLPLRDKFQPTGTDWARFSGVAVPPQPPALKVQGDPQGGPDSVTWLPPVTPDQLKTGNGNQTSLSDRKTPITGPNIRYDCLQLQGICTLSPKEVKKKQSLCSREKNLEVVQVLHHPVGIGMDLGEDLEVVQEFAVVVVVGGHLRIRNPESVPRPQACYNALHISFPTNQCKLAIEVDGSNTKPSTLIDFSLFGGQPRCTPLKFG